MPRKQRLTWTVVLRLAVVVTGLASLVVLGGGTALWLVEGERPDSTIHSWSDALWWSLTTLTTVGYGDHVPVTTTGRLIAAGVMVAGVAVIGAVAAIVALAVALRVAREEELAFEAAAEILEQRFDVRLARIEAQLAGLDARLQTWSTVTADDAVRGGRDDQQRHEGGQAKAGRRGKQLKLNARQEAHLVALHAAGEYTSAELAGLFPLNVAACRLGRVELFGVACQSWLPKSGGATSAKVNERPSSLARRLRWY
jgi:hypothetical protein